MTQTLPEFLPMVLSYNVSARIWQCRSVQLYILVALAFDHEIHSVTIMMKAMMQNIYIFKHFMSDMAYLTDAKA